MYNDFKEYPKWVVNKDGKSLIVNSLEEENKEVANEPKFSDNSERVDNKGGNVIKGNRTRGKSKQ